MLISRVVLRKKNAIAVVVYVGGLTHIQITGNWSLLIHDTKWAAILGAIPELLKIPIIDPQGGGT